jgi:CRP/FNR family cyclic AMP-dependent transcriptional regulator
MRLFTKDAKVDALKQVPLFEGLSKKELAEIASASEDIALQPGAVLVREGGLAREFFVLIDGTVEVTKNGKKIDERSGGDFVGEMGLISHQKRNATVTAKTPVRCFILTSRDFRRTLDDNRSIERKVLLALAERVANLSGLVD